MKKSDTELKLIIENDAYQKLVFSKTKEMNVNKAYFTNHENTLINELNDETKKLFNKYETLEIYIKNNSKKIQKSFNGTTIFLCATNITYYKKIDLPVEMKYNLLNFVKQFKTDKENYCCINFMYELIYGRKKIKFDNSYLQSQLSNINIKNIKTGEVVLLSDSNTKNIHLAINLNKQFYISLLGTSGPLTISTFEELTKLYKINEIYKFNKIDKQLNIFNTVFPIYFFFEKNIQILKILKKSIFNISYNNNNKN